MKAHILSSQRLEPMRELGAIRKRRELPKLGEPLEGLWLHSPPVIGSQAQAKLQTCPATAQRGPKREEELRGSQLSRGHRPAFSFQESLGGPQLFTTPLPRSQGSAFSPPYLQGWLRSHFPGPPASLIP